jgi:PAS domain S-box-containing protein
MSGLLDLLTLGSLVLLFTSIYRKRPTLRVRCWLIGWCLILVHFAGALPHPASELGRNCQGFFVLGSLLLGGICFILSTSFVRNVTGRWLAVLVTLGVPWLATTAAACFLPDGSPLLYLSAIAGEAATLMVAWRVAQKRRLLFAVLIASIVGCTAWLGYGIRHHQDVTTIDVMLTQVYLLLAVLYSFEVSRYTAGVRTVILSLYAWAAVWISATAIETLWPAVRVPPQLWNLPKYLVAVGMILTLLEEEIFSAEDAGAHYRVLFESNPHPMWMYDTETLAFLHVNEAAARQYGYTQDEFKQMTMADIRPGEEFSKLVAELKRTCENPLNGPWRHQRKDGGFMLVDIASHQIEHDGRKVTFALMQDVTERDRLHEQLVYQANHDILTGLPNRALLEDRMAQTVAHASRYGHKAALLCLDLDPHSQPRHRHLSRPRQRSLSPVARCRHSDVPREEVRRQSVYVRLAGDLRRHSRGYRVGKASAARAQRWRAGAALSAALHARRSALRAGSAGAPASSRARHGLSGSLHSHRGRERTHCAARQLGAR